MQHFHWKINIFLFIIISSAAHRYQINKNHRQEGSQAFFLQKQQQQHSTLQLFWPFLPLNQKQINLPVVFYCVKPLSSRVCAYHSKIIYLNLFWEKGANVKTIFNFQNFLDQKLSARKHISFKLATKIYIHLPSNRL